MNLGYRDVNSLDILRGYRFAGRLDEISVYNRALSSNEIAAIYNAGSSGKCYTPTPPVITTQPTNQTVIVGGTTTFSDPGCWDATVELSMEFQRDKYLLEPLVPRCFYKRTTDQRGFLFGYRYKLYGSANEFQCPVDGQFAAIM